MRILVLRFSSMGDVVLTTALLAHLKQCGPEHEITLCTNVLYTDLFVDDPRLAAVVPCERDAEARTFSFLANERWDMVVDCQNSRRSRRICKRYFPHVTVRSFQKMHWERFWLLAFHYDLFKGRQSVAMRYIRTVGLTDGNDVTPPSCVCYFDNRDMYRNWSFPGGSRDDPAIALFPFSAWRNKQWPQEYYREVGRYFARANWNVLIAGGPEDAAQAECLQESIGVRCISIAGKANLYETGCLVQHCSLALGNDTGLSHLARACGVKTGILFGATTRHFGFFPYDSPPYRVFESRQFCRPCHAHGGNWCWRVSRPCLRSITVEKVIEELLCLHQEQHDSRPQVC